jgi:hypothetical protein
MSLLTKNVYGVDVVKLFEDGIVIDPFLPKWVNAAKRIKKKDKTYSNNPYVNNSDPFDDSSVNDSNTQFVVYQTPEHYEIGDKVSFDDIAAANLKELSTLIKEGQLNNVLSGYGGMSRMYGDVTRPTPTITRLDVSDSVPVVKYRKPGIIGFLKDIAARITYVFNKPEIDAVKFFTLVKLTSKESAINYKNRVSSYLKAIHNAKSVGQTALLEKLLSGMIANKYESLLFSTGKYYVVDEETLVNFAKKTEKGVELTYIKNYARPIPMDIINKVEEMNNLEVFDNYVVLHYDPKGTARRETKREEAKRKDPIIFGVIAGSHKLYYVADWIDKHCDLTLEKFVETLGVSKDSLLDGDLPTKEVEEENQQKKTTNKKKPTKKKKQK